MVDFRLQQPFADLLAKHDYQGYTSLLANEGIGWLLDFQFPRIGQHLAPLAVSGCQDVPLPNQITLLKHSVTPRTSLSDLNSLFYIFRDTDDVDAMSGCIGTALQVILDKGQDFTRGDLWSERAEKLLCSGKLTLLAHCSLLLQLGWWEVFYRGNIAMIYERLPTIYSLAEKAKSPSLILVYSAMAAYIYCWRSDFAAFEIIVNDTAPYLSSAGVSPIAVFQYLTSHGLFLAITGKFKEANAIFYNLLVSPDIEQQPPLVWLLLHANYLYCLVSSEDQSGIEDIVKKLGEKAIPEQNQYFHAYLHFSLGVAALALSRPHKALLHCKESSRRGQKCGSINAQRMNALLRGQVLADLGRHTEALAHFSSWLPRWQKVDYYFIASLACVEVAYIFLKQSKIDRAREFLKRSQKLIPAQEKILACYRPANYVVNLERALDCAIVVSERDDSKPIRITTLGKFKVTVTDRAINEKKLNRRNNRKLLQAIISLGGRKISTSYLAELLWPDSDGDLAINSFKVTLHRLRKAVHNDSSGYPWLVVKQKQISLAPAFCSVDAYLFEEKVKKVLKEPCESAQVRQVLSLYAGNFLENESDETWSIHKKEILRDYYIQAVLLLFNRYKSNRDPEAGITHLIQALKYDPMNEIILFHLMESYLSLNNKGKALEVYELAHNSLKKTFNITPGKALRSLAVRAGKSG